MEEPTWQPISVLPVLTDYIAGYLAENEGQLALLQEAWDRPYRLDDATVNRVRDTYSRQADDFWLFEEQVRRWHELELDDRQRTSVEHLGQDVVRVREVISAILALAEKLTTVTIERLLAQSDLEAGLTWLARGGAGNRSERSPT